MTAPVKQVNGRPVSLVKIHQARPTTPPAASPDTEKPQVPPKSSSWRRTARWTRDSGWPATKTSARFAARHALYTTGGARIAWRRTWDGATAARYERMMRTAEAAGNLEEAKEWEARGQAARQARHTRRMALMNSPQQIARNTLAAAALTAAGLLLTGVALAIHNHDVADILDPLLWLVDLVYLLVLIASVVWGIAKVAGLPMVLAALWQVGRSQQAAPQWALPAAQRRGDGEPVTPARVVLALRHLGISALKKAILQMEDGGAAMLSPIVLAGCGVEVDVTLPLEVTTEEVLARRKKLAENLGRHEHELHPSVAPAARTVRLWIADSGALDEPIGPSPLVLDPDVRADYVTGRAPWGVDLRGDAAGVSVYQRHVLVTGASNQGKTAALRALALWLAFDPTVEFWIGDLKGVGDWRMFLGIAAVLIEGPTDEHVGLVTEMVERAAQEMDRRLMAPPGTVFPPLVVIVDEAQVAFMCPAKDEQGRPYGGKKTTSRYYMLCRKIHNQGRVVNVTLWTGTQDPTDENLPKLVRNGAHIRASLALGSESQSAMALGDEAAAGGAAPHLLRQGLDKGQLVAAGDLGGLLKPGQAGINIRTHYIDTDDAHEVAERIRERRSGSTTSGVTDLPEPRDHLWDLQTVILGNEERVRTSEVLHRLKNLDHAAYRDWDGVRLRRLMTDAGEDTDTYQGYAVIKRSRVLEALMRRDGDPTDD